MLHKDARGKAAKPGDQIPRANVVSAAARVDLTPAIFPSDLQFDLSLLEADNGGLVRDPAVTGLAL